MHVQGDIVHDISSLAGQRIPFLLIVDFELAQPMLFPIRDLPPGILFETPGRAEGKHMPPPPGNFHFEKHPMEYSRYLEAFSLVVENTLAGNTYLTNLTFPTDISTDLSLNQIYHISQAKYKLLYRDEFVVFSPETFVQIRDGEIRSFPMKGTINEDIPDARRVILEDEKEMAEHVTIVDLIRNDISIHASRVRVERFRYIDRLCTHEGNLLQVSSVITGLLPDNYHEKLGEILFSMLPAGSVSGAPKPETLRIIREAEGGPRGYYTGIMAYFDGHDLDAAVMIRYIENRDGELRYRSGGGITCMSEPAREYQEMLDKVYIPTS
jgi:para-aminobenzoate synthetase component 1